jgi:hypothetical protein
MEHDVGTLMTSLDETLEIVVYEKTKLTSMYEMFVRVQLVS